MTRTSLATNPFHQLLTLQRDLERALNDPMLGIGGGRGVYPAVNVFSDRNGLVIRAEVPGFTPDEIDLTVEPRALVIKGERRADEHGKRGSYHRRERQHGRFGRSIPLPKDLDTARATAECRNGLLTIHIPKVEAARPKQIRVEKAA
jgi:HSP20 family protein